MNEVILSNMLGCQTYCISDSPSNRYCLIGPIECNEKVCAFQKEGEKVWIEFIESEFGKPKEILRSFDFTVTKMAYYKEPIRRRGIRRRGR